MVVSKGAFCWYSHGKLGGGFKHFLCSPRKLGKIFTHFDLRIFFKGVAKNHQLVNLVPGNDCNSYYPLKVAGTR